jgi:GNAT superfamily N-acetyltransferase
MNVRRLRLGEGKRIRALRLDALSDAPYAFGSSFTRELEYPLEHWEKLAEQSESGERGVVFVAIDGTRWLGMAGGYFGVGEEGERTEGDGEVNDKEGKGGNREEEEADPPVASIWGMWVNASVRRHGCGRQLLLAIRDWASARGAVRLELSVTDRAPAAAALYREIGFSQTGEARPLASDPSIMEFSMTQSLEGRWR